MITFEEFRKIDLKIAKILSADHIEGSEKLLKLLVDIRETVPRQIIAGIGKAYAPDSLIGREIVIVANLEPRILMGFESQGMLLAAVEETPVIITPEHEVSPGTMIR